MVIVEEQPRSVAAGDVVHGKGEPLRPLRKHRPRPCEACRNQGAPRKCAMVCAWGQVDPGSAAQWFMRGAARSGTFASPHAVPHGGVRVAGPTKPREFARPRCCSFVAIQLNNVAAILSQLVCCNSYSPQSPSLGIQCTSARVVPRYVRAASRRTRPLMVRFRTGSRCEPVMLNRTLAWPEPFNHV